MDGKPGKEDVTYSSLQYFKGYFIDTTGAFDKLTNDNEGGKERLKLFTDADDDEVTFVGRVLHDLVR